jgi:signal transduction histidine kinase/HAMP domain-containing protein
VVGQARVQAEQAIAEARRRLTEWRRELGVSASLLAEQPTLQFYLGRGQVTKARELVGDFQRTSGVDYLRVQQAGRVIAELGQLPPALSSGLAFDGTGSAWRIVQMPINSLPDTSVVLAKALGNRLAVRPSSALIRVELLPVPVVAVDPLTTDPWTRALREVASSGDPETLEQIGDSAAVRIVRLRDEEGQSAGLLTARVAQDWVEQRTLEWLAAFGLGTLAIVGLAIGCAAFLASRIARPFAEVARAADRLGDGDLLNAIGTPRSMLREPAALAASLEQMRLQVHELTATERNQRRELNAVLDGVDEGIAGVDSDQRIHYANRQFMQLLGRDRDAVMGERWDELLLPQQRRRSADAPLPAMERCHAVGHSTPLIVRRINASGDRKLLIVREETPLEAAGAMRDSILANLSHEFQTPLSAQMASIELLRDHLRGSSDQIAVQLTDAQFRGALRLSQLVENLLDSVRIESGEMRLRRQPVELPQVIAEAVELMQPLIDQRDQRVVLDVPAGPALIGDAQRLFSVLVNLLANANKFAPDQTCIWISVLWQVDADKVTLWVEDEGPGLPALQSSSDLFAPFRRAPHEEPSQRGSGLGLAIVRAIVEAHGGQVLVAAPVQRSGARIGIVLPLAQDRVQSSSAEDGIGAHPDC